MKANNVRQTVDVEALEDLIKKRGLILSWVLEQAGISYGQLYRVRLGKRELTLGETAALVKVLDLSPEERDQIFFALEV